MAKAVIQANIQTSNGAIYVAPSAAIEIRDAGTGALVQLWEDRDGAIAQINPFNADANGDFKVYATDGRVNISATYGGNTKTWSDVVVSSDVVGKTSATGSAIIPSGTTAQRDGSPVDGYSRFNSTLSALEVWYSAAWNTITTTANAVLTTGNQTIAGIKTFSDNILGFSGTSAAIQVNGQDALIFGTNGITSGDRASFRNKIINGNFTALQVINQRASASRVTTNAAYNYDRWYYQSSGTKLTQAIESLNLRASTIYTVNWEGTATCQYLQSASSMATATAAGGWTAITKGAQLTTSATTVSAGLHLFIRFIGVTADTATLNYVQVEQGSLKTQFEHRPISVELALCQRYLPAYKAVNTSDYIANAFFASTTSVVGVFNLPVEARVKPTGILLSSTAHFGITSVSNFVVSAVTWSGSTTTKIGVVSFTVAAGTAGWGGAAYFNNTSGYMLFDGCEL